MDFRNWDPGNQGVTGFSYGILHHHKGIEGSGIYYAIVRGDLRQAGKSGIEGSGILLGVYSPIYTREVRIIISHALFIDLLRKFVVLEIKEDIYGSFWAQVWKVLIGVLIYIMISPYHRWVGVISEGICRINQILSALTGLRRLRGKVDLQDDRARSYKGVVINGEMGQQSKGRDHIEYDGKGKGKMYDEQDTKWVKIPEKGSNRHHSYRNSYRGEEGDTRAARGLRRGTSPRAGAPKEAREEGDIQQQERARSSRREQEAPPMIPLQENLAISIILADVQKNDVMELDEERVTGVENDEGCVHSRRLIKVEVNSDQATEGLNLAIGDVVNDLPEDKEPAVGGSTKARMVQALIATRKRTVTKPATRQGEGAKKQEEKGSSNPNPTSSKP
ncbi:hypothetical protein F2Q68_00016545 [Brassica cretica]|uniref:Uncharacterized protein n=1 Tax=Brassica cretica TaxID=69181 RepID=A0A8S9HEL4_BRACR|nr:hypothetical protein F2Q68_00016545 [Brassica cretica]